MHATAGADEPGVIITIRRYLASALVALAMVAGTRSTVAAQPVDERASQANPAAVIFRASLYGAGTGLVLGSGYALLDQTDASPGALLKWGVAGGVAAGALIGLIYWATRSPPQDSAAEGGVLRVGRDGVAVSVPTLVLTRRDARDARAPTLPSWDVRLVQLGL
jgi:hypothetical protein